MSGFNKKKLRLNLVTDDFLTDDIYSEEYRDDLVESGSVSSAEAGFMQGYMEA